MRKLIPQSGGWVPTGGLRKLIPQEDGWGYPTSLLRNSVAERFCIYRSEGPQKHIRRPGTEMPNIIYPQKDLTKIRDACKKFLAPSEFTYRDDPGYISFCEAIAKVVESQQADPVRHNKLYNAWFVAPTFRDHWLHPTKRSENDMLWILYNRHWSFFQGQCAIAAWWRFHHRTLTEDMANNLRELADRVWEEVEQKEMKQKLEAQQNSLRCRIMGLLQQHPATTAYLAKKLQATSKAVDSHLYRLRKEGIVERLSWGLYGVRVAATTPEPPPTTNEPARPPVLSLDDIDDGTAQPSWPGYRRAEQLFGGAPSTNGRDF